MVGVGKSERHVLTVRFRLFDYIAVADTRVKTTGFPMLSRVALVPTLSLTKRINDHADGSTGIAV